MKSEPCPFCEFAAGRIDQEIVHADDGLVAFLCEPPATWGHTLIVPRVHRQDIWSIEPNEAGLAMKLAHRLAHAMRDELGAVGVNIRQNSGGKAGQDCSTSTCTSSRATRTTLSYPGARGQCDRKILDRACS